MSCTRSRRSRWCKPTRASGRRLTTARRRRKRPCATTCSRLTGQTGERRSFPFLAAGSPDTDNWQKERWPSPRRTCQHLPPWGVSPDRCIPSARVRAGPTRPDRAEQSAAIDRVPSLGARRDRQQQRQTKTQSVHEADGDAAEQKCRPSRCKCANTRIHGA